MATDARRLPRTVKMPMSATALFGLILVGLLGVWLVINLVKTPSDFVEVFLIGLTTGCIYALVALGYTLVYGILELINFAHGDVFMLGGMMSATILASVFSLQSGDTGVVVWLSVFGTLLISMAFCGTLNASIEFVAYRPLRGAPRLAPLITAIGMSFILQNVALAWKGPNYIEVVDVLPH
jgi:branched-chain amino acid transport system permease protein